MGEGGGPMNDVSDQDLVLRCRDGDRDSFKILVARYQGHVYGLAYSLVGNWADAQDLAQETFIRAYSNLDQLREPHKFAAWLRRVTFSVTMNWLAAFRPGIFRQLDGKVDLDRLDIPDFQPGPVEVIERRELADAVMRAVSKLPPKYRVPLTMFHLDGLSYQKVADFLDIPLGTAKALIHRAKAQLKDALAGYAGETEAPMLTEVFNEHKLPAEFSSKILDKVPKLGWGKGRECTFVGALEAALAATDHPYSYDDLMGFTGLAFRTRWWKANEKAQWCPSCACGEMDEEITAASQATGWPLAAKLLFSEEQREGGAPDIINSINCERPVLAYDANLNMGIVYGYDHGGRSLFFHSYLGGTNEAGASAQTIAPQKLGWMWILLGEHRDPPPRRAVFQQSLNRAMHNFRRGIGREGPGDYWYGDAAFEQWSQDLVRAALFTVEQQQKLFFVSWWNFDTLADARLAAVTFLKRNLDQSPAAEREHVQQAISQYQQEADLLTHTKHCRGAFLGPWSGKSLDDWNDAVRQREREVLNQAARIEQRAIASLQAALQAYN
jgi:RNA polymerase sigma-70 factor, ECF subfamily